MTILNIFKPFLGLLPEMTRPTKEVPLRQRAMWTGVALFIFLVCCQVPLYGIKPSKTSDPFYWMRVVLASNKGTLMELGVSPIVTASLIMELLAGIKVIDVDQSNKEARSLFEGTQKIAALGMAFVEAVAYVSSGSYGDVSSIGFFNCSFIVAQLMAATVICILLEELLQKGWGIGSATSLFIATNICESILWKAMSPTTLNTGRGTEFEGALVAFAHLLITRSDKVRALKEAFYRPQLPNVINLLSTLLVFTVVIFLQGFRVQLKLRPNQYGEKTYDIKLFYTSNMPIILQTALISNFKFFSQILHKRFSNNIFVNLFGRWEARDYAQSEQMIPVGGLAHLITAPSSFAEIISDPLHAIFYITFVLATCALFSKLWISINHTTARDEAKKLTEKGQFLITSRENEDDTYLALNRYIPTAAAFGGLCIGALTIFADFLGAIGSGTGILLAVTTIYSYYELLPQENLPSFLKAGKRRD